jgi:hypothetical protein
VDSIGIDSASVRSNGPCLSGMNENGCTDLEGGRDREERRGDGLVGLWKGQSRHSTRLTICKINYASVGERKGE